MDKKKVIVISVCSLAGAAAAAYLGVSAYFTSHFNPNTYIDGVDVSYMNADQARKALSAKTDGYVLKLTGRGDLTDEITGSDIGIAFDLSDGELSRLMKENSGFTWISSLAGSSVLTSNAGIRFDADALKKAIASLSMNEKGNVTEPQDAYLEMNDGSMTIVPETQGTALDSVKTLDVVSAAVETLTANLNLDTAGVYKEPAVTADDETLRAEADVYNAFFEDFPSIQFGDTEERPSDEELYSWISYKDGLAQVDVDKALTWVDELAEKYNTIDKKRTLKIPGTDRTATVEPGTYGWELDTDATKEALKQALESKDSVKTLEPVWKQEAAEFGEQDYGDTYVAADLDNQHVYVVKDGKVVEESDCVSGKAVVAHNTPDGAFYIFAMAKNAVLRGPGYASPVSNWMPFYNGCGFHDATWRSRFGGKIYITNGSHGCINLPLSFATKLYDLVEVGTPVLVFGGMDQEEAAAAGYHTYSDTSGSDADPGSTAATVGQQTTSTTADASAAIAAAQQAHAQAEAANQALAQAQAGGDPATIANAQAQAEAAAAAAYAAQAQAEAAVAAQQQAAGSTAGQ